MSKLIKNRDGNFTHVKNDIFESGLSAKAMGIFCYLWHLPDDWKFYEDEITTHFKDGKASIRTGIKELEEHGFLKRIQSKDSKSGKFRSFDWQLNESPLCDFPKAEKPTADNPTSENRKLQSTKRTKYSSKQSTDVTNLSRGKATSKKKREKSHSKLQLAYQDFAESSSQELADLAMHYTKTRVSDDRYELGYFNTLVEDWQSKHLNTVAKVKQHLSNKNGKQSKSKVVQPSWLNGADDELDNEQVSDAEKAEIEKMLKKFD